MNERCVEGREVCVRGVAGGVKGGEVCVRENSGGSDNVDAGKEDDSRLEEEEDWTWKEGKGMELRAVFGRGRLKAWMSSNLKA